MKKMMLIFTVLFSGLAFGEECATTIDSTDAMQFDKKAMTVPASCESYTVTLTHSGQAPKESMGHNWVLSKAADAQNVAMEGWNAGPENDYLKPDDERIIAHTKLIGGGEESAVTFDVAALSAGESYSFFCSFPGHISMMLGTLTVE